MKSTCAGILNPTKKRSRYVLNRRSEGLVCLVLTALLACSISSSAWAENETHAYGVANFEGDRECGDSSSHSIHKKTAKTFDKVFNDLQASGLWDTSYWMWNRSVRGSFFQDASKQHSGEDTRTNFGADEADVIFIHTHGGHTTDGADQFSSLKMGTSDYACDVHTHDDMLWDSDLDIAVIKACQSGDFNVWRHGGYRQQYVDADGQMRMWNAFHGDSSCGEQVSRYVSRYARNVTFDAVGEEWIDQAFDRKRGANNDDCPTSIVFGNGPEKPDLMVEYGGWRDRRDDVRFHDLLHQPM